MILEVHITDSPPDPPKSKATLATPLLTQRIVDLEVHLAYLEMQLEAATRRSTWMGFAMVNLVFCLVVAFVGVIATR